MANTAISNEAAPAELLNNSRKVRYDWLDFLRAFAIILVIFGHQAGSGVYLYASFSSHLKLSLFFAVSGFLFSKKKIDNVKAFFKNKIFRLFLPYLYLSVISQTLTMLPRFIKNPSLLISYPQSLAKMLLHGDILWFVPNLFLTEIIMFIVLKITKKNDKALIILSCISLIAGYFALTPGKCLPFRVNALLIIWPIFVFGYLFRDYINVLDKKNKIGDRTYIRGNILLRSLHGACFVRTVDNNEYKRQYLQSLSFEHIYNVYRNFSFVFTRSVYTFAEIYESSRQKHAVLLCIS